MVSIFYYRILVRHFSLFNGQKRSVKWHISSDYDQEMSAQSIVVSFKYIHFCLLHNIICTYVSSLIKVPLGIQLKNEAKLEHMAEILDELNEYVPVQQQDGVTLIPRIVFGDQLTIARIRGATILRSPEINEQNQLKQFVGVISDWHGRLCLMMVCI